jgi:hypothetical protein
MVALFFLLIFCLPALFIGEEKTSFCNSWITKWDIPYGTVKKLDFGGLFDGIVPSILAKHFVVKEKYPGGPSPAGTTEICRSSHNLCTWTEIEASHVTFNRFKTLPEGSRSLDRPLIYVIGPYEPSNWNSILQWKTGISRLWTTGGIQTNFGGI